MKKSYADHIFHITLTILVGVFPIIALWQSNIGEFPSGFFVNILLISMAVNLLIYVVWLIIFKELSKSSMLTISTSVYLFTFGHIFNLIGNKVLFGVEFGFLKLFFLWTVVFIIFCYILIRTKRIDRSIIFGLNISLLALLLYNIYPILYYEILLGNQGNEQETAANENPISLGVIDLPDIYYIVLDSYTSYDVLSSLIEYDNSEFLVELEKRGFYLPECAYSNYNLTTKTIASVLNYEYLELEGWNIAEEDNPSPENINLIKSNKVQSFFSQYGYKFVTGRAFTPYLDIEKSDIYWNYSLDRTGKDDLDQKQFLNLYLNTTVFRALSELSMSNRIDILNVPYWLIDEDGKNSYLDIATLWYEQNMYMFDSLSSIPQKQGNYLVYAHIIAPHGPYVFNLDGSFRYPDDSINEKVLYRDSVIYINKRILEVIDTILEQSSYPPIIIIQGDHGIHKLTKGLDKHKILSAYYLPGDLNTPAYPTITPVNNFRIIIRNYFDPSMELLPDILHLAGKNNGPVKASCDLK